jgi:hypothetical protein
MNLERRKRKMKVFKVFIASLIMVFYIAIFTVPIIIMFIFGERGEGGKT